MAPSFSLHRFASSRVLRAVALLAWLLAVVSLPIVSASATAGEAHVSAAMSMGHAMHADDTTAKHHHTDHCCGDTAHPACHCEAMCSTVMLPSVLLWHGSVRLAVMPVPMRSIDAPMPVPTPPLRPPARSLT